MKSKLLKSIISVLLCLLIVLGSGVAAFAAALIPSSMSQISDIETMLAPGVVQNEKTVYDKDNNRVVYYTVTADIANYDTVDVYCNYKGNQNTTLGMSTLKEQVAAAEANHKGENYRVVAAENASYYNMTNGKPMGAFIMRGNDVTTTDPKAEGRGDKWPFFAIKKDGTPMIGYPGDYSKYKDSLQEAIGGHYVIVKDGKNVTADPTIPGGVPENSSLSKKYPRSTVGITADGKVVMMVADGLQSPYSAGLTFEEQADVMISMGCVVALELDGGGSATYGSTPAGSDEFQVLNRPVDGSDRSIANSLMIVSTAAATGELDKAIISSDYSCLTPNSTVTLSAKGVDAYGYPVDLPDGCYYQLADSSYGIVSGNKFTAESKTGTATVNMIHNGEILGSIDLHIGYPNELFFTKTSMSVLYGSSTPLPLMAYTNGALTAINGDDLITLAGDIESLEDHPELYGYVEGMNYIAPQESCGIRETDLYAMFAWDEEGSSIVQTKVNFHKSTETTFDFENAMGKNDEIAWNREITNTTTDDNSGYFITNPNEDVIVHYNFAMDMRKLKLPDELQPLWDAFGENLGGQVWGAFLKLANKIDPKSNITITLKFNQNLEILDMSDLSFSCEMFTLDKENIKIDSSTNTLTLPFKWNADYIDSLMIDGMMKPTDINPIGVFSGIRAKLKYSTTFDSNNSVGLGLSGSLSYSMIAISTSAYNAAEKNSLAQYQYVDPNNSNRKGIKFDSVYSSFADRFTLYKIIKDGWDGNSYYINGVAVKGMQLIDDYYYDFGDYGVTDGKYTGFYKFDDGWRYLIAGKISTGWQYIDDSYYWFDSNGLPYNEAKSGKWYVFSEYYTFTEKGKLVSGIWTKSPSSGITFYYYGPNYYQNTWATIDGYKYYFYPNGTHATGFQAIEPARGNGYHLYHFDSSGKLIEEITQEGLYYTGEKYYYLDNGICRRGLAQVGNDFYYFSSSANFAAVSGKVWVSNTNGLNFKQKYYNFDTETYKLIHSYSAVVTAPSCQNEGYTTYTCSDCGYSYKDNFVPKSHVASGAGTVTAPTCTEQGYTTYTCSKCGETYKADYVDALGHTVVVDPAVAPDCTHTGLTEGSHCSVCNEVLKAQETVPATGHTVVIDPAVIPDCTHTGLSEGAHCSVCGYVLKEQEVLPAKNHSYKKSVTEPTCTEKGYTTYTCSVCGDSYVADYVDALGHTVVVDPAVAPDCTHTGLTEGSHCSVCNEVLKTQETVPATGHSYNKVVTEPTCTEKGYTTYTCSVCGDSYVADYVDALGHTVVVDPAVAPDCTHTGLTEGSHCSVCNEVLKAQETVPATGHSYNKVVTEPTCTEKGYTTYTCSVCGDSYVADYVDALGHKYDAVVTKPTCTEKGYTTYTCSVCGDTYVADYVDALGHTVVVDPAVAPDCTHTGLTEGSHCSVCNEVLKAQETVPATGHSYDKVVTAPTCTEKGYTTYTCSVCGDSYVADYVDALGHTVVVDPAVAPDCTHTGLTEGSHCSVCNEVLKAQETVPATGHNYNKVVTAPTCTEKGYTTYTCSVCGDSYVADYVDALGHTVVVDPAVAPDCTHTGLTEGSHCSVCNTVFKAQETVPATGHSYDKVVTAPTCTEKGYTTYTCSVCGDTYVADYVDALGHTVVVDPAVAPDCTHTGLTEGSHCSVCNEVLKAQETVPATGHSYNKVVTEPTCTEKGYTTYTCSVCGDSYVADYVDALGHKYDKVVTAPTCTEKGYTTYTCSVCGDSYVADYVDALGHTVVVDPAVAPDCTHTGLTEGSHCSVCNEVLKAQETVPATGHSYDKVVTAPTCTEQGYTTYTCSVCGDSYVADYVDALGHKYDAVVTKPTCTEKGYTTYTCSVCGDSYVADYVDALGHSYSEAEFVWTEDSSAEYGWTVTAAKTCANCSDKLIAEVTITRTSYKELVASAVFTDGSTASDTKIICGDITLAVINGSGAVITNDKFIYGLAAGLDSIEGYVAASADGCEVKVTKSGDKIGTGTLVEIYKDGYLVDTYTVVIFGDVDGDGWYDAQDAFIVSLIVNGLLTREQIGEAKYLAADCNHDGEINASDVEILENAGLLLGDVDQSKSQEELETDSAYEEYSELVNQLSTNEDEPNKTDFIFTVINSLIAFIVKLLKSLSSLIKQF